MHKRHHTDRPDSFPLSVMIKVADEREKEIFSLKMQIHFLNERLNKAHPENNDVIIKTNINLKVLNQSLEQELKDMKKHNKDLQKVNQALRDQNTVDVEELMDKIEQKDREIEDAHQMLTLRNASSSDGRDELVEENYRLREDAAEAAAQLQQTNDELLKLRNQLELRASRTSSHKVQELEDEVDRLTRECAEYEDRIHEHEDRFAQAQVEFEELGDALEQEKDLSENLRLQVERMEYDMQRASDQRSESRAEMLEEREEREAVEEVRKLIPDFNCHRFDELNIVFAGFRAEMLFETRSPLSTSAMSACKTRSLSLMA